ncbi:MAG: 1-(5-phosphoribosyl)-5-[(5-phosphoribosylamino)methylideneamino]imidazole-4-carboxamide isomerase [Acidimicrobiales bacterium]
MTFHLYPAIDVRDGRCVRLMRGDYDQETVYGDDPVAQARAFADAGAPWIHVVDLDAARSGVGTNTQVVTAIVEAVDVPIQTGGGIRSVEYAEALLGSGVERVVIGTAAVENPGLVEALASRGYRVAVGLDGRGGNMATHGWEELTDVRLADIARRLEGSGVDAVVVTEIGRDGTMAGPDLEGLAEMLRSTSIDVIASGGVGELAHLRDLVGLEAGGRYLAGAIVGRALYEGKLDLHEAITLSEPRP